MNIASKPRIGAFPVSRYSWYVRVILMLQQRKCGHAPEPALIWGACRKIMAQPTHQEMMPRRDSAEQAFTPATRRDAVYGSGRRHRRARSTLRRFGFTQPRRRHTSAPNCRDDRAREVSGCLPAITQQLIEKPTHRLQVFDPRCYALKPVSDNRAGVHPVNTRH